MTATLPIRRLRALLDSAPEVRRRATLHPDVVFRSPAVFTPYVGREATMRVLTAVMGVFEDFRYVGRSHAG